MNNKNKNSLIFDITDIAQFAKESELDCDELNKDIIDGLFPCGITLLFADEKTGKSLLAKDIAVSVADSSTTKWMDLKVNKHGKVLYFAFDDLLRTIHNRFDKFQNLAGNLYVFTRESYRMQTSDATYMPKSSVGKFLQVIEDFIKAKGEISMIVVDTFEKIRETFGQRDYAAEVDEVNVLKNHAEKYGYSMVLVHHTTKMKHSNPHSDYLGSSGLGAEADVLIKLESTLDSDYQLLNAKGNNFENTKFYITRDSDLNYVKADVDDADLVEDIPDKSYLMIVKALTGESLIDKNNKYYEWNGEYQDFVCEYDLPTDSRGLGKILTKYENKLKEQHIFFERSRTKRHRLLKIWIDRREGGDKVTNES